MIFQVIPHPNTRFHRIQPHPLALEISYHRLQQTHGSPVPSIPQLPLLSSVISAASLFRNYINSIVIRNATTNPSSAQSTAAGGHSSTTRTSHGTTARNTPIWSKSLQHTSVPLRGANIALNLATGPPGRTIVIGTSLAMRGRANFESSPIHCTLSLNYRNRYWKSSIIQRVPTLYTYLRMGRRRQTIPVA
ncbi:uncharacterized protein BDW47DRAFT_86111 [Aspergillus candidus]|uniref:Uncharacterized protein n=1 Tax=Aspergillus candidus TaxID=41067 RepID=A0A2I2EZT2_ASPCN|nr:hypothetical protein BDW47DRAFT_86111 [Aspergillus candidus]PLB33887.1 hypothetical protein BDW47DRAFT_86111 [Aspergillus candidus]